MKITLLCDSLLLQKSLQNYLKEHIVSDVDADIIICDKLIVTNRPVFLIGHSNRAHLRVPFTKKELFWALEDFYIQMLESKAPLTPHEQIQPILEKLNRKHHQKIAKLARKIY